MTDNRKKIIEKLKEIDVLADRIYNITKDAKYGYNLECSLDIEDEEEIFDASRDIKKLTSELLDDDKEEPIEIKLNLPKIDLPHF